MNAHALLIGVGRCLHDEWSLKVATRDVIGLKKTLADPTLCAYPAEQIHLLRDKDATREGILAAVKDLAKSADEDPDATFLVYYSGHGWRHDGDDGERYFLIPHDVRPRELLSSALSADDFIRSLRSIRSRRLLVMIDTCHAAAMADAKDLPVESIPAGFARNPLPKSLVEDLASGKGRAVFLSCGESQQSWFRPEGGSLSFFTHHLICALEGAGCAAGEQFVKVSSLMSHISTGVPRSAEEIGKKQTPFFKFEAQNFPVALIRGGKGVPTQGDRPIPELLPYMPNRADQKDELYEALRRQRENPTRPVVCLVPGDEFQAQEMFIRRLKEVDLPKLLELPQNRRVTEYRENRGVTEYRAGYPRRFRDRKKLRKRLRRTLADVVLNSPSASVRDINQRFAQIPRPVLIHAQMWLPDCGRHAPDMVRGFLDFFRDWPDLSPNQILLVLLLVKYRCKRVGYFERRRRRRIYQIFENYESANFGRLTCMRLSALEGVGQMEVEEWAWGEAAPFCKVHHLIPEIRSLFQLRESATIPMEHLAESLTEILDKLNPMKEIFA